jgi:hypothetical protein
MLYEVDNSNKWIIHFDSSLRCCVCLRRLLRRKIDNPSTQLNQMVEGYDWRRTHLARQTEETIVKF